MRDNLPGILERLNIAALNEMQQAMLDAAPKQNILLLSPTGTGKTLAFLLPVWESLDPARKDTQALVIVPSRELALQIEQVWRTLGTGFKVTCCYGGHKREIEENSLVQAPALIVGTPGRLADHFRRGNIDASRISTVVLDEFDKTLELGFVEEVSFLISSMPALQRRILTSATDAELPEFAGSDFTRLDFLPEETQSAPALTVEEVVSEDKDKIDSLFRLLCMANGRPSIVFCNHRESVERVSSLLTEKGISNTFYHGAMEQRDRETALARFRNGSVNTLITTDLAARGLDIAHIRYIIHYHLPSTQEAFIHRNGRTARMDASGTAILIRHHEEKLPDYITEIEERILPEHPSLPEKPKWSTLFIGAGKKDKVNKVDIVGFLTNKGQQKKEDVGLIEVKDFFSFVAVRRSRVNPLLQLIKNEKIKNRKIKIELLKNSQ